MRSFLSITALVVAAVLFVAINIFSTLTLPQVRLDLTERGLFTLSDGTRAILDQVAEPITLRFFFSEKLARELPTFRVYGNRVRELLEEYQTDAGGKIRLEVIDPEPFSRAEDRAVQAGLQGVPLDQTSGEQVFFGLVGTNTINQREVIPFFQQSRERFLEYDLTKLIYNLTDPTKPVLGIVGSVPFEFGPGGMAMAMRGQVQPYVLYEQLRQLFEVRTLEADQLTEIEPEVTVLMVARPKDLPEPALYAIDQYILGGGKAVLFVDPWAESAAQQPGPQGRPNPMGDHQATLSRLFDAWGLELAADQFVADPRLAMQVATGRGRRQRAVPYPAWLSVPDQLLDRDDVVTADLGSINLATAGSLKVGEGASITLAPLVSSSPLGQLLPIDQVRGQPDPEAVLAALSPSQGETLVIAGRVTGTVETAFPDGPPPADDDADPADGEAAAADGEAAAADGEAAADDGEAAADDAASGPERSHLSESRGPVTLIVVADSDLLEDRYWVQSQDFFGQRLVVPIAANGDLVVNAIDNLTGSSELIGLRGRAASDRPFTRIEELQRTAARQFLAREQELQSQLTETERQLRELQTKSGEAGKSTLVTAEEQQAIDRFRGEVVRIRRELRDVQHNLNKDIERLQDTIKVINIGLVPVAVALLALILAAVRSQTRRRRRVGD